MNRIVAGVCAALFVSTLSGCAVKENTELGSEANPVKMAVVPSGETGKITTDAQTLADALEEETGLKFKVSVPVSYAAVTEAMGAGRVDIAWLNPLSYVLAHEKAGADVMLIVERDEHTDYFGIILTRTDTGISKLTDLKGKKFAFVDPLSTTGALYPKDLMLRSGINPEKDIRPIIAGGHDKAIFALMNKQVDACAVYGGYKQDARDKVKGTIPDIKEKTVIIAETAKIPNDNVSASKDLPADIRKKIQDALLKIADSPEGEKMLMDMSDISGLKPGKDSDYDSVRQMAKTLDLDIEETIKKD